MAYGYSSNPGPDPGDEEMDSLYAEGGKKEEAGESIDQEEREQMQASSTLPIRVLQKDSSDEVKVGDERVVRVTAVHGEEATVVYATDEKGDKDEGEKGGDETKPGDYEQELDAMAKEG